MKKTHLVLIALLSLSVFHVINNIVIILRDTTPFIADASDYYKISFYYWRASLSFIKYGDFHTLGPICPMGLNGQLLAFVAAPFYFALGVSHDVAIIANQSFFLILMLSIFGIGTILFNRNVGLLAAFIISFYPSVFGFSRVYMLTFPILAISALCIFLLIKSDGFKSLKYSIYFGFVFGLGELLRPRFIIYIIFPVLYYIIRNIIILCNRQTDVPTKLLVKKIMINIFFSATSSYLLLFPWYSLDNISEYLNYQKIWSTLPHLSKINSTLPYYLQMLFGVQLRWFFASLFLLGLVISLFDKNKRSKIYFLLMWFVLSLISVASFGLKDYTRLVVPLCVPIALVSSAGMERLARRKISQYLLFALLFFSVIQYFLISYTNLWINKENGRKHFTDISLSQGLLQANNNDWEIDNIISIFKMRRNFNKELNWRFINKNIDHLIGVGCRKGIDNFIKILYIDFRGSPIGNEIEERILIDNLPISIISLYPDDFDYKKLFSDKELQLMVLGADYVVVFEIEPKGELVSKIVNIFNENISKFEKLKTIETPWSECLIYGKRVEKF